ncbi:MAG: substrate-binding domain-containing protein [Marinobacter sp.]
MLYRPALMLIFLLLFTMSRLVQASAATGRTLTAILEQKSQRLGLIEPGQPLPLFALSGTLDSSAAKGRQQGLMETVDANRTRLLQLVDAQWDRQLAKDKSLVLLKRYPQVAAIWSASDGMALGAIEAAKLAGRRPGKDVLVGGVDWEPEALESIRSGELAVSLGRHFMGGGLALLLLHDYHYGFDFSDDKSPPVLGYQLKPASLDNVDTVEQVMDPEHWQNVDFRRFSRRSDSGKPERRQSADELLDEFTRALTEAYPRSSSRLPVSVAADSSPDSVNR